MGEEKFVNCERLAVARRVHRQKEFFRALDIVSARQSERKRAFARRART